MLKWPVLETFYDHNMMIIMSDACTINKHSLSLTVSLPLASVINYDRK
jgi:hypothetical protein